MRQQQKKRREKKHRAETNWKKIQQQIQRQILLQVIYRIMREELADVHLAERQEGPYVSLMGIEAEVSTYELERRRMQLQCAASVAHPKSDQ
jgi:hypothetical protein